MNTSPIFSEKDIRSSIHLICKKGKLYATTPHGSKFKTQLGSFCENKDTQQKLINSIQSNSYHPVKYRGLPINRPGKDPRIILIPSPNDRVVYRALFEKLRPHFEILNKHDIYGYSLDQKSKEFKRGVKEALLLCLSHLSKYSWYLKLDIQNFFPSIPQAKLLKKLHLIGLKKEAISFIKTAISVGVKISPEYKRFLPRKGIGIPQGCSFSPIFANYYALPFEELVRKEELSSVRYLDDMIIFCNSRSEAIGILGMLNSLAEEIGLKIHKLSKDKSKTCIEETNQGLEYLGVKLEKNGNLAISDAAINKAANRIYEKHFGYSDAEIKILKSVKSWAGFPKYLNINKPEIYIQKLKGKIDSVRVNSNQT